MQTAVCKTLTVSLTRMPSLSHHSLSHRLVSPSENHSLSSATLPLLIEHQLWETTVFLWTSHYHCLIYLLHHMTLPGLKLSSITAFEPSTLSLGIWLCLPLYLFYSMTGLEVSFLSAIHWFLWSVQLCHTSLIWEPFSVYCTWSVNNISGVPVQCLPCTSRWL